MSELVQLQERVKGLEDRTDVEGLARGTDRDVADWRTTLNNHTDLLNGMGDKIDLFQERVDKRFTRLEAKVDANFTMVDANFTKMEDKFELLRKGQDQITKLLTRHLGEPDEEMRAGDADE